MQRCTARRRWRRRRRRQFADNQVVNAPHRPRQVIRSVGGKTLVPTAARKSAHVRSLATRRPHLRRGMHAKVRHFEFPWKWVRIPSRPPRNSRGLACSLVLLIPMSANVHARVRTSAQRNHRARNRVAKTTTRRLRTPSPTVLSRSCVRPSGISDNEDSQSRRMKRKTEKEREREESARSAPRNSRRTRSTWRIRSGRFERA